MTVRLWARRFVTDGVPGVLREATRPGRRPRLTPEKVQAIVEATLTTRPSAGTHWSSRGLAEAQGVSDGTIRKIWRQHGLQPHRVGRFKLSTDPHFVEKLRDVVGLYLNPAPPESGIRPVPAASRAGHAAWPAAASDSGQPECTQESVGATMADPPPAGTLSLRPDQQLLAESRRTLVCGDHSNAPPARHLHQRAGARTSHPRVLDSLQSTTQAVHLDKGCRHHPREDRPV